MDLEEGQKFALGLDSMESGFNWWCGDFILCMEALHGELAAQIIPENKAHSWSVYRWVAERVKPTTRRPSLSWSHHSIVASLLTERQTIFLDRAETEQLSVSALRKLIKAEKGVLEESVLKRITCPSCGFTFEEVQDETTTRKGKPNSEIRAGKDDKVSMA
jgi:predicted Zn-ribbon and HTH transcriptional regulator